MILRHGGHCFECGVYMMAGREAVDTEDGLICSDCTAKRERGTE